MDAASQLHRVNHTCVGVEFLVLGFIANNVYLIDDGAGLIVVDPSCRPDDIMRAIGTRKVDAILVTHNHSDHVGALAALKERTNAVVIASAKDASLIEQGQEDPMGFTAAPCVVDQKVSDGDIVEIAQTSWRVMATPGHTKGGVCYYIDPRLSPHPQGHPVLISGDTLFAGSIGRTDFAGGSMQEMRRSLAYLAQLPDNTVVLPGHNQITTIQAERKRVFAYFA